MPQRFPAPAEQHAELARSILASCLDRCVWPSGMSPCDRAQVDAIVDHIIQAAAEVAEARIRSLSNPEIP